MVLTIIFEFILLFTWPKSNIERYLFICSFDILLLFIELLFNEAVDIRKLATELIGFSLEFKEFVELSTEVILNMLFDMLLDKGKLLLIILFLILLDLFSLILFSGLRSILATFLLNKSIFGFNSE